MTTTHTLKIRSLRDVHASCACGGWEYARPAFDYLTDAQLHGSAQGSWETHVYLSRWTDGQAPSQTEQRLVNAAQDVIEWMDTMVPRQNISPAWLRLEDRLRRAIHLSATQSIGETER